MSLKQFNRVSCLYKSGVAVLLIAGVLTGCSSDFSRFTDGLTKSSASSANKAQNKANEAYPPAPQKNAYGKVESDTLAPPADTVVMTENESETGDDFSTRDMAQHSATQQFADKKSNATAAGAAALSARKAVYTVQAGDNLTGIARRHNVTVAAIKRDNALDSDKILIGQKLTIAGGTAAIAAAADKPAATGKISHNIPTPVSEPIAPLQEAAQADESEATNGGNAARPAENTAENTIKPAGQSDNPGKEAVKAGSDTATAASVDTAANSGKAATLTGTQTSSATVPAEASAGTDKNKKAEAAAAMLWPVKGNIISSYGQRTGTSTNDGIDIAVPEGTKVKAADKGIVIYAGDGLKEFGNTILIRHDDNIVTVYGHNSKLLVQRGQQVERDEDIALSGSSGNASVAKLHFEVRKNSSPVNPMKYLSPAGQL
ncbi:MAG: M23 family peptidase [Candidatus Tokpelaia sp.]|nr:MAG: M23 family peptidase [Candidatus Tokpelaia sp.]KAA6207849.1 MAG: M23 family peptidase [Candidatus Tokpelaia sp.]